MIVAESLGLATELNDKASERFKRRTRFKSMTMAKTKISLNRNTEINFMGKCILRRAFFRL